MKQNIAQKEGGKPRKEINGKCNNMGSANENKHKQISLQQFLPSSSSGQFWIFSCMVSVSPAAQNAV
jgi:hypothetical protein